MQTRSFVLSAMRSAFVFPALQQSAFHAAVLSRIAVLLIAAVVDLLIGDPHWLWHPVQGIGTLISISETALRKLFHVPWPDPAEVSGESGLKETSGYPEEDEPSEGTGDAERNSDSQEREAAVNNTSLEKKRRARLERLAGFCLVVFVLRVSVGLTRQVLSFCGFVHPWLRILTEGILCGRLLALRSLGEAGISVRDPLRAGNLEEARRAVSMIVGRDTDRLDGQGIGKAAVETVAENTSDGVTAPFLYMLLLGGPGGMFYKAVNTMDSMIGYKNDRYRHFGTAAARLDDIVNYIPSRLTALFMILACHLPVSQGERKAGRAPDAKSALRIWKRDRRKSPSPNSAQTESVCAGALHIRLLGDTWYFGKLHHKAEIGDGDRPVETEDITRAVHLMNGTSGLMFGTSICLLLFLVMFTATGCAGNPSSAIREESTGQEQAETLHAEESAGSEQTQEDVSTAQGTFTPAFISVSGGTGRVTITCPEVTIPYPGELAGDSADADAEALLVFSSPHYEWVKVNGVQYDPVNAEDQDRSTSEFRIPATLEKEMEVIGLTTAMSEPHEIAYTILISMEEKSDASEGIDSGTEETDPTSQTDSTEQNSGAKTPPALPGLEYVSGMDLTYAKSFDIFEYRKADRASAGGEAEKENESAEEGKEAAPEFGQEKNLYRLIDVHDSARYLLVPDGETIPEGLPQDVVILKLPLDNIYVAATSSMALFDAAGALNQVRLTGTEAKGWYIDAPKKALEEGTMIYAGKYSAPDYELLTVSSCGLAVESTMILHAPEVKEKLEEIGIPVFIDTSSTESHPLGRTEWVRLYGVLTGHEEQANAFFASQLEKMKESGEYKDTGKTVAFFSITSTGNVIVRASEDYIPGMIKMAGGRYIFTDLENTAGSSASVRLTMETFYDTAKDADYLIYNATIESPVRSLQELIGKSSLLADFKAVQNGNVWQIRKSLYQSPDIAAELIRDLHIMLTDGDQAEMAFMEKVE